MQEQKGTSQIFVMRVLWGAMLVSQVMFLFILSSQHGFVPEAFSVQDYLRPDILLFIVLALVNAFVAYMLPAFLVRGNVRLRGVPKNEMEVIQVTFVPYVLRFALTEAIALFGFVSAMQIQKPVAMLPFLFLSVGLFLWYFPTYQKLRALLR